jgi:hypothetical protein
VTFGVDFAELASSSFMALILRLILPRVKAALPSVYYGELLVKGTWEWGWVVDGDLRTAVC